MKKSRILFILTIVLSAYLATGCLQQNEQQKPSLSVDFTKYELENGLDVILHQDHSDPIVSLAVVYHVGSNREKTGRTGALPYIGEAWYRNTF